MKSKLALLIGSVVVALGLLEVLSHLLAPGNPFNSTFALYPHSKRLLNVTKQGRTQTISVSTNRWGLRGEEPPSDWNAYQTIVTVGGSTTQCYYLDDHQTWSYKLEENLKRSNPRVWVGNAGLDGHTTFGHLELEHQVISRIRPKAIVVLVGINDAALALHSAAYLYDQPGRWTWQLYRKSRVAQLLYTWYLILAKHVHHVRSSPQLYTPRLLKEKETPLSPTDLAPYLEAYKNRLRRMIHLAQAIPSQIYFLTQPILWDETPFWQTHEGGFYWINDPTKIYSGATCARILKMYNQALLSVCREEKLRCLDLASAVPHSDKYFYDNVHFNEEGTTLVADRVAAFLKP